MTTFRRWLYRIAIPFLVVALIALALRWTMLRGFYEQNVRPAESATFRKTAQNEEMPFTEENREHVVAALKLSKSQLDQSLQQNPPPEGEAQELERQAAQLQQSIENLKTVQQENWQEARDQAYDRLKAYATAVGELKEQAKS